MNRYQQIKKIAHCLASLSRGGPKGEDASLLEHWRCESPRNEKLYGEVVSGEFIRRKAEFARRNDIREAYLEFLEMAACRRRPVKRRRKVVAVWSAAASAVLLIVAGTWFAMHIGAPVTEARITPGSAKAVLTLSDGRSYDLTEHSYGELVESRIVPTEEAGSVPPDTVYNTITIPRGGEYRLTLDDGTTVFLNSESSIRLPVPFGRRVEMTGEAFFDVVPDTSRPFRVGTRYGVITVTGTSFNVRDYADEVFLETTLVEGSVTFQGGAAAEDLLPGEQLRVDKVSGRSDVRRVALGPYVSWKEGRFVFEQQRLEDIMGTLARWYNVEVRFTEPALKDILFSGNIKRYEDFDSVLEILRLVNKAEITDDGRTITVSSVR